ncbi:MAG: pilus assembly protein N-terminal domain-containing protein, partial [Planctomycetaceae bacterium]|nr:pilus assembly protein N-terminal domain-containing protein [Planctomycetaceae bacterium]
MLNSSRYQGPAKAGKHLICIAVCGLMASFHVSANGQDGPRPGLDARIVSMPKVERKLEIIQNRSQLIKTAKRVTRMAIADPSVIDIAPFEENEFAIIGAALGTTTLTLWFEDDNDPLIYEVTTIRDPNIEEQLRIDYGKLERKLAILFPNSKVYLIPLHEKLVVKGQARDGAEAARILQIIEGEFLDDYGGLGGPGGFGGRGDDFGNADGGRRGRGDDDLFSGFLVNMLQVPGEFQVMLHVTIAELNRSQLRRMGVDFNVLFANGRHAINSAISGGVPTLTGIFENGDITVLIAALASNGTAKILSRPSLTTLSGHPATFLAGGEFAVPTIVGLGGAAGQQT